MCMYVQRCIFMQVSLEARDTGCPWSWSYKWVGSCLTCVLEIQLGSSAGIVSSLNCRDPSA